MVLPSMEYTATVSGSVPKFVRCEQCGFEYVYELTRRASGQGTSFLFLDNEGAESAAHAAAHQALVAKLEDAIDPVPCLGCGHYQADMVALLRRRYLRWMTRFA